MSDRDLLLLIGLLAIVGDVIFGGMVPWALGQALGFGTWYDGRQQGESPTYAQLGGARYRGWLLAGLINIMISDKRLILRVLWSRFVLLEVPLEKVRYAQRSRWWWYRGVAVVFGANDRDQTVEVFVGRKGQDRLLAILRSIGVKDRETGK